MIVLLSRLSAIMAALDWTDTRTRYGDQYGFRWSDTTSDQPEPAGDGRRLAPVVHPQLAEDVGDVELDRARADVEAVCDLAVAPALGEEAQDLPLARRQGHPIARAAPYEGRGG